MEKRDSTNDDEANGWRTACRLALYTFDCRGCGRCVESCPQSVLQLIDNGCCRFVQAVGEYRCTECGRCVRVCDRGAVKLFK